MIGLTCYGSLDYDLCVFYYASLCLLGLSLLLVG